MKTYKVLLASIFLAAPMSLVMASERPDLDDVTMDVVRDNNPREITHDISLPGADDRDERHGTRSDHAMDDKDDDMSDDAEEAAEHAAEAAEEAAEHAAEAAEEAAEHAAEAAKEAAEHAAEVAREASNQ